MKTDHRSKQGLDRVLLIDVCVHILAQPFAVHISNTEMALAKGLLAGFRRAEGGVRKVAGGAGDGLYLLVRFRERVALSSNVPERGLLQHLILSPHHAMLAVNMQFGRTVSLRKQENFCSVETILTLSSAMQTTRGE